MQQATKPIIQSHEFFYFFNVSAAITAIISIITTVLMQMYGMGVTQSNPGLLVFSMVGSLLGLVVFVSAIIALFIFRKRRYPNLTLAAPIILLVTNIFTGIIGGVVAMLQFQGIFTSSTTEQLSDPTFMQQQLMAMELPLAVAIVYYLTALVQLAAVVVSVRAIKNSRPTSQSVTPQP